MTVTPQRRLRAIAALLSTAISLAACVSPSAGSDGRYAAPIGNAPVISNETPYSQGLRCLAPHAVAKGRDLRVAVGQIADYTGKEDISEGHQVTQGAALMAMSALSKTGVHLVERFDTSVAELELKYANIHLLSDGKSDASLRPISAGAFPGSDYYLIGGITELDANIRTVSGDISAGGLTSTSKSGDASGQLYVMNVALDLRLVSTTTLEVVDVISYQKQIIGREVSAGVFDFLGGTLIDVGVDAGGEEPIQLAVRSVIERGMLEMMSRRLGVASDVCGGTDPLASAGDVQRPALDVQTAPVARHAEIPYEVKAPRPRRRAARPSPPATDADAALRRSVD